MLERPRAGKRFHSQSTPIHASKVNSFENPFSILERRVSRYWAQGSKKELAARVMGFLTYWNDEERQPFTWRFKG